MSFDDRIKLFREMMTCDQNIHMFTYTDQGTLIESNCPDEQLYEEIFNLFGCKDHLFQHVHSMDYPMLLTTEFGVAWLAAVYCTKGNVHRVYLLGPIFTIDVSRSGLEKIFRKYEGEVLSLVTKHHFIDRSSNIPLVAYNYFLQYGVMFHYCVTGEKIKISDIVLQPSKAIEKDKSWLKIKDRHKTWSTEKMLLHMVETGDMNYLQAFDDATKISSGIPLHAKEPMRKDKNSGIVFTSLCTRAAIEGGLSPEVSYSLGDAYIQEIENCESLSEITKAIETMYKEFITKVHDHKADMSVSSKIRDSLNYIQTHIHEKINIKQIAENVGYTEYYLSKKFKAEVGETINQYMTQQKLERAKLLLRTTDDTIQSISELFSFSSRSYFSEVFRKAEEVTPVAYRKKYRNT